MSQNMRTEAQAVGYGTLCALTLYGQGLLEHNDDLEDAQRYFNVTLKGDCNKCPAVEHCPVCRAEE